MTIESVSGIAKGAVQAFVPLVSDVTVVGSRNLVSTDIGNQLINASGAPTLTIPTGIGVARDLIFFHPITAGTQTLAAGAGVTLNNPYNLGLSVPTNGLAVIQCDGTNVWTRQA